MRPVGRVECQSARERDGPQQEKGESRNCRWLWSGQGRVSGVLGTPDRKGGKFGGTGTCNGRRKEKVSVNRVAPVFMTKQIIHEICGEVMGVPRNIGKGGDVIVLEIKMMTVLQ